MLYQPISNINMTRDKEEKERFGHGHSSGNGKSGNSGSSGKDKMAIRHRHNETSHQSDDRHHRSHHTTRKGLRIFVGTANLSQAIPGMFHRQLKSCIR